jgi:hypothetical protein
MELFNKHTRPAQCWVVLISRAMGDGTIEYRPFERLLGYANTKGLTSRHWLGWIAHYCYANGLPLLNELVVSNATGVPGDSAPNLYGRTAEEELAKIRAFDWFSVVPPTNAELRAYSTRLVA